MKFAKSNSNQFFKGLRQEVDQYFKKNRTTRFANTELVVKGLLLTGIYFLAYASLFLPGRTPFMQLCAYITMGVSGVMIVFNIVHDASHHALSPSKGVNNMVRYLGDLVGINTYIWDIRHNVQHHTFTNVLGGDLIIENIPLLRLSQHQPYKRFHRFQLYYAPVLYLFYTFYWMFVIDFKLFFKKEICNLKNIRHPRREWALLIFFKTLYVGYTIVLPWLFTPLSLLQVVALFLAMHMAAGILLSIVAVLGHFVDGPAFPDVKDGLIDNSWSEHELDATIDFSPGSRTVNWITGGLNTHVAHHLFPHICHIHYYKLTPLIEAYCRSNGYPYKKETLAGALASHIRYLKKLSQPA